MSFRFGGKIITDGLVLYLDAANKSSYPGSGTTWYDLSINKVDFTLYGSPTFDGKNFEFGVSSVYAKKTYTSILDLKTTHTLDFWVYPYGTSGPVNGDQAIIRAGDGADQQYTIFYRASSTNKFFSYSYYDTTIPDFIYKDCTGLSPQNKWYNIVATKNGTSLNLYINGQLDSTHTVTTSVPTYGSVYVGGVDTTQMFEGKLSCGKIYNRALSASEVLQNYNALKGRFGL
jgi:hypothetical protein